MPVQMVVAVAVQLEQMALVELVGREVLVLIVLEVVEGEVLVVIVVLLTMAVPAVIMAVAVAVVVFSPVEQEERVLQVL